MPLQLPGRVAPERLVVPAFYGGADDAEAAGKLALVVQLGEGRQQEAAGEVARRAEQQQSLDHHGLPPKGMPGGDGGSGRSPGELASRQTPDPDVVHAKQ